MQILNPRIVIEETGRIRRLFSDKQYKVYLQFGVEVETRTTRSAETRSGFVMYAVTPDDVELIVNHIKSKITNYSRRICIFGPGFITKLNINGDNHMLIIK